MPRLSRAQSPRLVDASAPLLLQRASSDTESPTEAVGPLMALLQAQRAEETSAEDVALTTLDTQGHDAVPGPSDDNATARRAAMRSRLRGDAMQALKGLRQPLAASVQTNVRTLQAALGEWDAMRLTGGSRHVVMLEDNVGLDAHGIGLVKGDGCFFDCGREERAAVRLGALHMAPDAFVESVRARLVERTQRVAAEGLSSQVSLQAALMPLGRPPLRDEVALGLIALAGVLTGQYIPATSDAWSEGLFAGGVGAAAMGVAVFCYNGRWPLQPIATRIQKGWDSIIDAPQGPDLERAAFAVDVASDPSARAPVQARLSMPLSKRTLRRELAQRFFAEPIDPRVVQSQQALEAAMVDAIAPYRARAQRFVSILRDPQTFGDDPVLKDIVAYLAALDDRAPDDSDHTAYVMGSLQASRWGLAWRDDFYGQRHRGDDGMTLLFAGYDADDDAFLAELRRRFVGIAQALADTKGAALRTLQKGEYASCGFPEPYAPQSWRHYARNTSAILVSAGGAGSLAGLGLGAFAHWPLLESSLYPGGVAMLGAGVLLLAEAYKSRQNDKKYAHRLTLEWMHQVCGERDDAVRIPASTVHTTAPDGAA